MCTVSYFKTRDSIIFTSNRDEKTSREKAVFPNILEMENQILYFPKDKKASGTWFAADDRGNVAILLNGAFQKHTSKPPYKKSRGIVLLDFLNENESHLFSSKTLYNDSIEKDREKYFRRFQMNRNIESGEILNFHKKHQIEKEPEIDFSIKEEFLTVSITQVIIRQDKIHFAYHDLTQNTIQHTKIEKRSFV